MKAGAGGAGADCEPVGAGDAFAPRSSEKARQRWASGVDRRTGAWTPLLRWVRVDEDVVRVGHAGHRDIALGQVSVSSTDT